MNIEEIAERLKERVEKIKKVFLQDGTLLEASISRQVVEPVLRDLEWPTDDGSVVGYEYSLGSTRADIALLHEGTARVVVEVKKPGSADGAEEQLFNYTYHAGVSLAVLTTGQEWEFYLPLKPGGYEDRQVYKLDISARETEESVSRLMRYLFYPDVCSGKAVKMAEEDHGDKTRARKIEHTLPNAWDTVLSECDDSLMTLLQDKVGDKCGFRPDSDVVRAFVMEQSGKQPMPHQKQERGSPVAVNENRPSKSVGSEKKKIKKMRGFELHGRKHESRNNVDTLNAVFEEFIKLDASFPDRFMRIPHGKARRWLAYERSDLYPARPDLVEKCSRQLSNGHWIGTNYNGAGIKKIIEAASKVAGINYGRDLKILY